MNGSIGGPIQGLKPPPGSHYPNSRPVDYEDYAHHTPGELTPGENTPSSAEDHDPAGLNSLYGWGLDY